MDIEEAREILITLGANADKRLKFSERHALAKYLELRDELKQQLKTERAAVCTMIDESNQQQAKLAALREALEDMVGGDEWWDIHESKGLPKVRCEAILALLKQGGE